MGFKNKIKIKSQNMLLLAWTPVTHNSNRASVHVNVAQDLPTFHSSLHKIIKSQKKQNPKRYRQLRLQRFFRALLLKNSAQRVHLSVQYTTQSIWLSTQTVYCMRKEKSKTLKVLSDGKISIQRGDYLVIPL